MHDLTPLYEYIHAQRRAGLSDATTYHNLISAGWSPEVVSHAMNNQNHHQPTPAQTYQNPAHPQQAHHQQAAEQHFAEPATQDYPAKGLFKGRINRSEFLMGNLYILLAMTALFAVTFFSSIAFDSFVVALFNFLLFTAGTVGALILTLGLYARRWHDLDQSGWFALFWLAIGFILFVILAIIKGGDGPNKYGPVPAKNLSPKSVFGF